MSAGALSREVSVAAASTDWIFSGTGDYNANGTDDVLFQNTGPSLAGSVMAWEMAGGTLGSIYQIVAPPT